MMADTDTPDLDLKLPDGTQFKGNLQDAMSSLPNSMQPDLQRIGADMTQRSPAASPNVDNNQVVQKMNDYYANVDQDRQKQQGMLDKDLLQNQQERHSATEELKHTLQQGPQHAAKPEVPKLQPDQITPVFGALMVMAALSGVGARNHAAGALNAMNGVMEGSHTGNKEMYDRSMKEFEEKSRQAVEAQKEMLDEWNSKIKVGELARSDLEDEARNFHLKYPQLKIDDAIMQGQPSHMFQVMDAAQKNIQHVEDANRKFIEQNGSSGNVAARAAAIAAGQPITQVVPGYGTKAANERATAQSAAIEQIKQENPGMTDIQAGQELAHRSVEFQAGKSSITQLEKMRGATKQNVDQLDFNIQQTKDVLKRIPSSDISPVINAIARSEEKWTGDPAFSSLFYYLEGVGVEAARLRSGGQASIAQLHQGAAEEARNWVNINMTPASFDDVSASIRAEGQAKLKTYGDAIKYQEGNTMGGESSKPMSLDDYLKSKGH